MTWNPSQYLQFEDERLRPAVDLLARIAARRARAHRGPGLRRGQRRARPRATLAGGAHRRRRQPTRRCSRRRARRARGEPRLAFERADLATWRAATARRRRVYSNAALHWLDGARDAGVARVFADVAPRAVRSPCRCPTTFARRRTSAIVDVARVAAVARGSSARSCAPRPSRRPPTTSTGSRRRARGRRLVDRVPAACCPRGDGRRASGRSRGCAAPRSLPFMAVLDEEARRDFAAEFAVPLCSAYPRRDDGSVLFPFRRLFIVASKYGTGRPALTRLPPVPAPRGAGTHSRARVSHVH